MKRRLFNLVAAVSLLLFLATVAFGAWTFETTLCLDEAYMEGGRAVLVASRARVLVFLDPLHWRDRNFRLKFRPGFDHSCNVADFPRGSRDLKSDFEFAGFGFWQRDSGDTCRRSVAVPLWAFVAFFAIAPALKYRAVRRERMNQRPGLCRRCGYDLRASKERCPECGTAIGAVRLRPPKSAAEQSRGTISA